MDNYPFVSCCYCDFALPIEDAGFAFGTVDGLTACYDCEKKHKRGEPLELFTGVPDPVRVPCYYCDCSALGVLTVHGQVACVSCYGKHLRGIAL